MPQNQLKLALIILTSIILAACGGGGGGGNNQAPVFSLSSTSISVSENSAGVIYTAKATDADGNTITYSVSSSDDQEQFSIGRNSGELQFHNPPDYENPTDLNKDNIYEVKIGASDGGGSSNMSLTVTVTNVIEAGESTNQAPIASISVSPDPVSTMLTTATSITLDGSASSDPDEDTLTYTWSQPSSQSINLSSTDTATTTFTAAESDAYTFTLTVSDGQLSDSATTELTITDGYNGSLIVAGAVVDGYISDAIVCIDSNLDYDCRDEPDELQTTTDANGNYYLAVDAISLASGYYRVLATGGYDLTALRDFDASLSAVAAADPDGQAAEIIVSPASTVVDIIYENQNSVSLDEAQELAADFLNLSVDELALDPVAHFTSALHSELFYQGSKLIKSFELILEKAFPDIEPKPEHHHQIYQALIASVSDGSFDELSAVKINGVLYQVSAELDIFDAEVREFTSLPEAGASFFASSASAIIANHDELHGSLSASDKEQQALDFLNPELLQAGNDSLDTVINDLYLPQMGKYRSPIDWQSSNEAYLSASGVVRRPTPEDGDVVVVLTATSVKEAGAGYSRDFTVTIKAQAVSEAEAVIADIAWLSLERILGHNQSDQRITTNMPLPTEGANGSAISWHSDNILLIERDGAVTRTAADSRVELTATVVKGEHSLSKSFQVVVLSTLISDQQLLLEAESQLDSNDLLALNLSAQRTNTDLYLPTNWLHGSQLVWDTNNSAVISATGQVTRPEIDIAVQLSVFVNLGGYSASKKFNFTVLAYDGADSLRHDFDALNFARIASNNLAANKITSDLNLYTQAEAGSEIVWSSSMPSVISSSGVVNRPSSSEGDASVELTATLTNRQSTASKSITLQVLAEEFDPATALAKDYDWLDFNLIANGNSHADNIIDNLRLPSIGAYGSSIDWSSYSTDLLTVGGYIRRPTAAAGDQSVVLIAELSHGDVATSKQFTLTIKAQEAIAESLDYSQPVYNRLGDVAQYELPYLGRKYRLELLSNVVLAPSEVDKLSPALSFNLQLENKLFPQTIQLPSNYRHKNIKLAFYEPHDATTPIFTSPAYFLHPDTATLIVEELGYERKMDFVLAVPDVRLESIGEVPSL